MTSLAKLRQKLLTDPEVKAEYDRLGPIFAPLISTWRRVMANMTLRGLVAQASNP